MVYITLNRTTITEDVKSLMESFGYKEGFGNDVVTVFGNHAKGRRRSDDSSAIEAELVKRQVPFDREVEAGDFGRVKVRYYRPVRFGNQNLVTEYGRSFQDGPFVLVKDLQKILTIPDPAEAIKELAIMVRDSSLKPKVAIENCKDLLAGKVS